MKRLSLKYSYILFMGILICGISNNIYAQTWSFELNSGVPYNIPLPLKIYQKGCDEIKITAKYSTEPFTLPYYWMYRFSRWKNDKAWEFEDIHHKLYLKNKSLEIKRFGISHGFNLLYFNRAVRKENFIYRVGVGCVLAHAESTIRDKQFGEFNGAFNLGYYICGASVNISVSRRFYIYKRLYCSLEAKFTPSFARVPIADGHADVYNAAVHGLFGLGVDFIKR